ncbi:hypothetical protein ABGB12_30080 [Actinocorallia sp. B10E7]|uniref:hypothetical protein n=1 Tax=Actinocorallia sp. B10E7 TaxID=3153558 RepID=UPI00325DBF47
MSEMLWLSVPGGIAGDDALLRVLIVPRLGGGSLSGHGMEHWPPQALRQGAVRVEAHGPDADPQTPPALIRDLAPVFHVQPGLWERLVAGLMVEDAVTERAAAPSGGPLTVRPTSQDAQAVMRTLQTVSQSQVTAELGSHSPDFQEKVRNALHDSHWTGPDPSASASAPDPAVLAGPPERPAGFHRTLSMLREHPAVLRALGLIVELRLDAREVSALAGGTVRVLWPGRAAPLPEVVSPRTRFGAEFLPASMPQVNAGMVTLDRLDATGSRRWEVVTVEVDVAAQRMREAARAVSARPDETAALPALRSGGLQLVFRGRGQEMRARLARAARARAAAEPEVLTADDLVLGYRIDVRPGFGGAQWFSLHRRNATYRIHRRLPDGGISDDFLVVGSPGTPEEGHIKTNAAIFDGSALYADETVASWRGWSLAVPRPGFDPASQTQRPSKPEMNVTMGFEVEPGSVPRLRFGQFYTLRARVVDIAGGGLELHDPAANRHSTQSKFYARYEPVASPDVVLPEGVLINLLGPGESTEHIVVRSDPVADLDVSAYGERFGYRVDDERVLLPPATTVDIAEQHGMFDLDGDDAEVNRLTWEWVKRALSASGEAGAEGAGLPDPAAGGVVVTDVRPGAAAVQPRDWDGVDRWPDLLPKTLELTTPSPGRPQVGWEDGRLVVRLAPAEQITLQLSTFPRKGIIDDFALHAFDLPENSLEAAQQGRHPMLTPARTLTLVHAVQRPLRAPETVLLPSREAGATFAGLAPQTPLLDPKSTVRLEITAGWQDQMDRTMYSVSDVQIASLDIDQDDPAQPATLFRHEFGDTRHRRVTYTLRAVSRFRHYFRDSDDPQQFTQTRTLPPVNIPSTSRPAPPVVLSARPAFLWKETGGLDTPSGVLTRERLGTRVRLALQSPWHTTGVGESLAVVVRPEIDGSDLPDERLANFISRAGHDPIYPSVGFRGGGPFASHITTGAGPERRLRLKEADADVVIKPHEPTYSEEEKCWLCDVAFAGSGVASFDYTFLQLAVARYQPNSLDGLFLSDVVKTDMVPLLPGRTLRVTRLPDGFEVRLTGAVSAAPAVNRVDFLLERCRAPEGMPADRVELIDLGPESSTVPAWVFSHVLSPVPKPAGLSPALKHWTSRFFVAPGTGSFRLRVREVELIPNREPRPGAHLHSGKPGEITERLVFTDVVSLPIL